MKNSLLKSFFSSGVQAIAVQVLGVAFFYIVAKYMPKHEFGIVNWVNATTIILITLTSFGLDQVVVRRIASSKSSDWAASAYLFHMFISSLLTFIVLILITLLLNKEASSYEKLQFLPLFFAVQAIVYLVYPLKQFLNAKHNFIPYAVIAIISNIIKLLLVIAYVKFQLLSIINVGVILGICAFIEFIAMLAYVLIKTDFSFRFKPAAYFKLLKEASPQYVSVIFDVSLARSDWFLLGILSTAAVTAEYSIAYRAFEISRLPVTVIAPVILNIFAKMLLGANRPEAGKQKLIRELYTIEIFAAMMLPLVLNIVWSPVLDLVFKGEYGSVNEIQFLILSVSIPLMFIINLLWTLAFSIKKYKQISFIIFLGAIGNIVLNLILIPQYQGTGAAIAFLLTVIIQLLFYYRLIHKYVMKFSILIPAVLFLAAAAAYVAALYLSDNIVLRVFASLIIYIVLALATKTVTISHFMTLKQLLKK